MNKQTNNIIFYTLILFVSIILLIGIFFWYKSFFSSDNKIEIKTEVKDVFADEIKKKIKEKENKEKEYVEYENEKCSILNKKVSHGKVRKFFSRSYVGVNESCEDFAKNKKCFDGEWLGEYKFKYTSCDRIINCKLDKDTIVKNGESIKMFSKNIVPFGDDCRKYQKIIKCRETRLIGMEGFKYKTCRITEKDICSILGENGEKIKIPSGKKVVLFSRKTVKYNDDCSNYSENRFCSNGILYGNKIFSSLSCKKTEPKSCFLSGVEIKHGQSKAFYSKSKSNVSHGCGFYYSEAKCNDGVLLKNDGTKEPFPVEYSKVSCS